MTLAATKVEIGFTSPPGTAQASIVWTDVTPYVLAGLEVRRGRSSEFDDFPPGTCRFRLDNSDRRFDPSHATGPYFGNLKPMRPVRVRATHNAVTYDLFTGYLLGWPQTYSGPLSAIVDVDAVDGFDILAGDTMGGSSPWAAVVAGDAPTHWWRLGEPDGETAYDEMATAHGEYVVLRNPGESGAVFNDPTKSVNLRVDASIGWIRLPVGVSGAAFSVEGWYKTTVLTGTWLLFEGVTTDGVTVFRVRMDDALAAHPWVLWTGFATPTGSVYIEDVATSNDGEWHHFAVTRTGTTFKLYRDGVEVGTPVGTVPSDALPAVEHYIGQWDGSVQDFAVYDRALSAGEVADHYDAGFDGWAGETSGARVGRILDYAGWPAADRDLDTGLSNVSGAKWGSSALSEAKSVEKAEAGRLHMSPAGKVVFTDRHATLLDATIHATFGDGAGEFPVFRDGFEIEFARDLIWNTATGSRPDGAPHTAENAASVATYRRRTDNLGELLLLSDVEVVGRLEWHVDRYKDPLQRIESVVVKPNTVLTPVASNALWAAVLAVDIGKRYRVKRRPQKVGTVITVDAICEGVSHTIGGGDWTTTLYLSPADTRQYWIWGTSEWGETDDPTTRWGF